MASSTPYLPPAWVLLTNSRLLARKRSGQPLDSIAPLRPIRGIQVKGLIDIQGPIRVEDISQPVSLQHGCLGLVRSFQRMVAVLPGCRHSVDVIGSIRLAVEWL
jgi:hypothetical protein